MHAEIAKLRSEGYLVISTFQHQEDYRYTVKPEYRLDFTGMADAGAVIVSGSQAHQPQNMEFYGGSFIHYGLGNLFFDQITVGPETSQAFIDRHVFYNGRYLGTELITVQFVDMARSRPMTPEERASFLQVLFKASGW
jgi:poly-gamma-glutamate synthesis protein (capsule biosynthesis protein)